MASTFGTQVEIRKFDGKNFAIWKEMMQDMLIIRRQVEAIQHSGKPASMSSKEWRSIDEITRSTIQCLFQYGKGDNIILSVREVTCCV